MTVFETEKDILIVDIGVQFSEDDTPGVDFILPNTRYLEDKKEKIRGVVITHGHLDHIGGIPYILDGLGNPPIFTRHFTALMIKKRQEEFPGKPTLDIREIETNDTIQVGDLVLRFFGVTHAIPDSMAVAINTPWGEIVHTGDLRLQHVDGTPTADEFEHWKRFDQPERKILALLTDSTNCENPGFSLPEARVMDTIEGIIKTTLGRLVIATFSSQVDRMIAMITMAEKYGKKVFVDGRSMKNNLELIRLDGRLKVKDDTIVPIEDVGNYPESKVVAIVTGAQGEEFAALMRIANKTHKHIRLSPRDTVLMSSSIIPGNERGVQKLNPNQ
jgi:ribonuclease J